METHLETLLRIEPATLEVKGEPLIYMQVASSCIKCIELTVIMLGYRLKKRWNRPSGDESWNNREREENCHMLIDYRLTYRPVYHDFRLLMHGKRVVNELWMF